MKNLIVLRKGMKNELVGDWQTFLIGLKIYPLQIDDDFGTNTEKATKAFQAKYKLGADGIVGSQTWSKAIALGFHLEILDTTPPDTVIYSGNFPEKPGFPPILSNQERERLFGHIAYIAAPTANDKDAIRITNNFERDNIIRINLPQLAKATNGKYASMRFHKAGADQLRGFFSEIEEQNKLHLIKSYAGAYYPRFIRGRSGVLSNHSYGTAFDINVPWNGLGKTPALIGQPGCVRELVPIAHKWGFYWGGHFSRPDGMHFELAKIR